MEDARRAGLLSRDAAIALCVSFNSHTIGQEGLAAVRKDNENIKADLKALISAGQKLYCNVAGLRQSLDDERRQRRKAAVATSVVKIAISAIPFVGGSLGSGVEAIGEILQGRNEDALASAVAVGSFLKETANVEAVRAVLEAAPLALAAEPLQYLDGALEDLTIDDLKQQLAMLADRPALWLPTNGDGVDVKTDDGESITGPSPSRPSEVSTTAPGFLTAAAVEEPAESAGDGASTQSGHAEVTVKVLDTAIDEAATYGVEWGVMTDRRHRGLAVASGGGAGMDAGRSTVADNVCAVIAPSGTSRASSWTGRNAEGVVATSAAHSSSPLPTSSPAAAGLVAGLFDIYEVTMTSRLVACIRDCAHEKRPAIIASMRAAVEAVERDDVALGSDANHLGMNGRLACAPLQPAPAD